MCCTAAACVFFLRGNAAACVCAALPLNETHTRFSHTREIELVAIWASLKEHRHAVIDCLCMEPLRRLEGNCKDLGWPLEGPWKVLGRPLEGLWKALGRPLKGPCKATGKPLAGTNQITACMLSSKRLLSSNSLQDGTAALNPHKALGRPSLGPWMAIGRPL